MPGRKDTLRQPGPGPASTRLLRGLLYSLTLAGSAAQFALVPILPAYTRRFGLSGTEQGLLLGAVGFAMLVVSLPAGRLSDRFGARRLTLGAGGLITAVTLIQAEAGSYPVLLASRLGFGAGYAVIWTAGLSWLAETRPGGAALGGSVASSGAGGVAGPALSGVLVTYLGLRIPFIAAAGVFALITVALGLLRAPSRPPGPTARPAAGFRAAAGDRGTLTAVAAIITAGVTTGVSALLVPDELHAAGASPARIGLVFAVAGVLFVAGSSATVAAGRRAVRHRVVFASMLALAAALLPAALTSASVAIISMQWATTAARSVMWTVAYPLAATAAEDSGAGLGVVMGVLNGVWSATALLSPVMAGFAVERLSPRLVFALTAATCLTVLGVAVARHLPGSRPAAAERSQPGIDMP